MPCSANPLSDHPYLETEETRQANVRYLKSWMAALERENPKELEYMGLPIYNDETANPIQRMDREQWIRNSLDVAKWQLAYTLRWSIPRRLVEAVPALTWLLKYQKDHMQQEVAERDLDMSIYLGVALSDAGRIAEAETVFEMVEKAIAKHPDALPDLAIVWLRASHARNLRFLNRTSEALPLEKELVAKFNAVPRPYMPCDILERVLGPGDNPDDHPILNLVPHLRGTTVLSIRNTKPLEAFEALDRTPYPLTAMMAHKIRTAFKQFCDGTPMDLQVCLHTQGALAGQMEVRTTMQLHQMPRRTAVNVNVIMNDRPVDYERPLPGDPFEIDQEDFRECWLTRCGKTKDLKLCTKCYTARYCSQEHQIKAWKLHKVNCKEIYRVGNVMGESKVEGAGEKGKK